MLLWANEISLRSPLMVTEAMRKSKIHRVWLIIVLASAATFLLATQSWCRLMSPPSRADVRVLTEKAPLVFRGRVLTVTPISTKWESGGGVESIAKIQVDRWYRGAGATEALLPFTYNWNQTVNGHDCIDFRPDTYWVVFASEKNEHFEMIDDCEGALTISPLLGPDIGNAGWLAQMEADFLAGLNGPDSAARLASIQRLGGLKLASSRDALRRVIQNGDDAESKWAVYAALRTGDVSVLATFRRKIEPKTSRLTQIHV